MNNALEIKNWAAKTPLSPGRELDALIAKTILGQTPQKLEQNSFAQVAPFIPKPYSTDMAAAWEIVDKIHESGKFFVQVRPISPANQPKRIEYICEIIPREILIGIEPVIAPTAPFAICLAALKTVIDH